MFIVTNKAASVFAAIEKIAATSSKTEKEALVKIAGDSSPMFMKVVKAAYDPFINYGMRALPPPADTAPGANTLDEPGWWEVLDTMAKRQLTGDAARLAVSRALAFLDPPSAELFRRIIRKDLRAGFTEGTINRVFPKTFADFPYMRCSLPDKSDMPKWDWSTGIISQEKADGMFANVDVDIAGQVQVTSRSGTPIPLDQLGGFADAIAATFLKGTQTHGELTVIKDGQVLPREDGNGQLNAVAQGGRLDEGCTLRFDAWDQIPLTAVVPKGKFTTPYKRRLGDLIAQVRQAPVAGFVRVIPTRVVRSKAEAMAHYAELLKSGKEGTICKHPDAIWKDGTSKEQVKLKLEVDVDLEIVSVVPGTIGTKNEGRAGSLDCRTRCGGLATNVTIKNEKMRDAVDKDPDSFISKVMTVRANSIMAPSEEGGLHSLFLPRFVEDVVRLDKAVADDLETVRAIFRNAVEAA